MSNIQKKINKVSERGTSKWSKDADYRIKNRKWLKYSSNIARRILAAIEDKQKTDARINQSYLANAIGVSPQYISRVVKGRENLTLETIARISDVLGVELISFPHYKDSKPVSNHKTIHRSIHIDTAVAEGLDAKTFDQITEILSEKISAKVTHKVVRLDDKLEGTQVTDKPLYI